MKRSKQIHFLLLAAFVAACHGARMSPSTTTTTTPLPTPAFSPVNITLQEISTPPAMPVCADATDPNNPLGRLRSAMRNTDYTQMASVFDAFIIFFSDEHLSEDPAPEERRLEYISGWDGPGTAAVLADGGAAIWVPSGDVTRARSVLSCAWLVLDADHPSQPTVAEWITERLSRNSRIGGDNRLTSIGEWHLISTALLRESLQLVHNPTLIDTLWNEEPDPDRRRPDFSKIVAKLHDPEYTGMNWREKVSAVREELRALSADAMVVTALDEVSWLLNVRGRDVPHAPLLKAFVIVTLRDVKVFVPPGKLSMPVREVLGVSTCFNCTKVNDYTAIYSELRRSAETKILVPSAGTFQRGASAAIAMSVPPAKRLFQPSPIIYLKATKNEAEAKAMRRAHLRDAVAMCTLFSYIEGKSGLDELAVTKTVDDTRETQAGFISTSMKTRVAFSANGAEPEYKPTVLSNRRIFKNATLVVHSGGQYTEGTTVVTRTVHFGIPSREERRAYTTVLRSLAALSTLSMPSALPAAHADPILRAPLWGAKQDYMLPTGYGVGAALNRKEDPVVIDYRQDTNLHTFREGYFVTAEPGWYDINKFGVRLGNVLEVVAKPNGYLGFRETTLLPFEPKLIDRHLLTDYELSWLNSYNERIRKVVGPELRAQGLTDVYYWMTNKTTHVDPPPRTKKNIGNSGFSSKSTDFTGVQIVIVLLYIFS